MSTASVDPSSRNHPENLKSLIWSSVSHSPLHSLWDLQGIPLMTILKRTVKSFQEDNLLSRAAELGYYFLFALFPTLLSASSIIGLFVRTKADFYPKLLNYLSLVVPPSASSLRPSTRPPARPPEESSSSASPPRYGPPPSASLPFRTPSTSSTRSRKAGHTGRSVVRPCW